MVYNGKPYEISASYRVDENMGVNPKIGENHQIINSNRVFPYKPSILGIFPLFLETPIWRKTQVFFWGCFHLDTGSSACRLRISGEAG